MPYIYNDEDNAPMNSSAVEESRQKFLCRFRSICPVKRCDTDMRDNCGWYFKFLDLEQDAEDIRKEQLRALGED